MRSIPESYSPSHGKPSLPSGLSSHPPTTPQSSYGATSMHNPTVSATEPRETRSRSQSPVRNVQQGRAGWLTENQSGSPFIGTEPINRRLFGSPSRAVLNTEFTGRTFSEREIILKDKRLQKGAAVTPALPKRTIADAPWQKAPYNSKPASGESEEEQIEKPKASTSMEGYKRWANRKNTRDLADIKASKQDGASARCRALGTDELVGVENQVTSAETLASTSVMQSAPKCPNKANTLIVGTSSEDSSTSGNLKTLHLPGQERHYEAIIYRTFPEKKVARGKDIPPLTRKCSFPISEELARTIFKGKNVTFAIPINSFGGGTDLVNIPGYNPLVRLPISTASDGTNFPASYLSSAERQFEEITSDVVTFQRIGYGRWATHAIHRRVVIPDSITPEVLGPHVEAVVVIRLEGFIPGGFIGLPGFDAEGNLKPLSESRNSTFENTGDSIPTTTISSGPKSAQRRRKIRDSVFQPREKSPCSVTRYLVPTPLNCTAGDYPMSQSAGSDGDHEGDDKDLVKRAPVVKDINTGNVSARGIRLSISKTPMLRPTLASNSMHATENKTPNPKRRTAREGTVGPEIEDYSSSSTSFEDDNFAACWQGLANLPSSDDLNTPAGVLDNIPSNISIRKRALQQGTITPGKTYVSIMNPSNPIPGAILSPAAIHSEPTLRMIMPTPPKLSVAALRAKDTAHDSLAEPSAAVSASTRLRNSARSKLAGDASSTTGTRGHLLPTRSLKNLADAGFTTAAINRLTKNTAASQAKAVRPTSGTSSRPGSPEKETLTIQGSAQLQARPASPEKRSLSPSNRSTVFGRCTIPKEFSASQPTAASLARAGNIKTMSVASNITSRPKSRGGREKSPVRNVRTVRSIKSLKHEGVDTDVISGEQGNEFEQGYFHTRLTKF